MNKPSHKASVKFDNYKVYILYCYKDEEEFVKIGRTYIPLLTRFGSKPTSLFPYFYTISKVFVFETSIECFEYEQLLLNKYKEYSYKPLLYFGGNTECFTKDILNNSKNND